MVSERLERRLSAILAADVAEYSRLTGLDEEGTHVQLQSHLRSLIDPTIAEHRGRIVKNTGDGLLAEFSSVVEAVRCALDVQRGMVERNADVPQEKRIEFRIGINVGDIITDRGDLFGDVVNVAARLEGLAEPGGICISEDAHRQVRDKLDIEVDDAGEQQLKNITRAVRVYGVRPSGAAGTKRPALVLPDKPSIAVLPFRDHSGDPEQEYFADGIVEEIITALSRFKTLFVIARNSSFTYKGRAVDAKQVGRELGVRYVLEGSVRRGTDRVRITGQLIDAATGAHVWAQRFDGVLGDIFQFQDEMTANIVGALVPRLEHAEIERARRKPRENLDAYDYYLRGLACIDEWTREANNEALGLFHKAIELDRRFASAYGLAAYCYVQRDTNFWLTNRAEETAEALRLAQRAAELDKDDAYALCLAGVVFINFGDLDAGAAMIDRALALSPNLAIAWLNSGWARIWQGEPELATEHLARAMRLSPIDPVLFSMQAATAFAHFIAGRSDEALSWSEKASWEQPLYLTGTVIFAASSAVAGQLVRAQNAMARLLHHNTPLRISNLKDFYPFRRPQDLAKLAEGLRKAGLPE
ncbi:MAG: adenylate/guanylate cyclase domain-containing protein [Tardiphaga sp.]